ncbi:DNA polymerase III subunit epsilon [Methylobacterium indicum]|uniref:DNA polymerase III subunit epsilon n=1 Tax=Methylobacterium indicum TaxID=1775910 RepID=A0A8H8X0X0_9HYPH|nr:DNA polymerase III subunit epsilon [Methylobacterium indicum]BCM87847.1 DNA polymerase III subunit epsilon [Methylobacterium indicum]
MREIALDTETTGLSPSEDRVVEIGAVELVNLLPTGRTFHTYIDPKRSMPKAAYDVHGLSESFLAGKPVFRQILPAFLEFVGDAPIIAHNAAFDMGFLNAELARLDRPPLTNEVKDTLEISRRVRAGMGGHSLDTLCRFYDVDLTVRDKHGALIDARLLAGVYLALMGGRQMGLALPGAEAGVAEVAVADPVSPYGPRVFRSRITDAERANHLFFVATLKADAIWHDFQLVSD